MYAVIATGGKQYRVTKDGVLRIEKLDAEAGATVEFGQVLLVGTGRGMIETRDGDRHALHPGDIVWAAPGEEHWHGAAPDSFVAHTAISLGATQWLEEVAGDRYEKAFEDK